MFDLGQFSTLPLTIIASNAASGDVIPNLSTRTSVDDTTIATVSDNGDGTATLVRVSQTGGSVTVTAEVTNSDGSTASGTLVVSLDAIVAPVENADTVTIVPGVPS